MHIAVKSLALASFGKLVVPVFLVLWSAGALAQNTPQGLWKTFDEDSGRAKSVVRITEKHGLLEGRIERLLDPEDDADALCGLCADDRRNQKIVGLSILRNLHRAESAPERWEGGEILDPENGKSYHSRLTLSPDGRHLAVRGYVGLPLVGRTQTWQRMDEAPATRGRSD